MEPGEQSPTENSKSQQASNTEHKSEVIQQRTSATKIESQESPTSKAVSLLDVNKISDWKSTLSGALSDQQLFWALFVLGIFYLLHTCECYPQ